MPSTPLAHWQDDDLVRAAQGGDDGAFAELMRRHYDTSLKLALSILRDYADAEDEAQNAWWKAFEHLGQFNGEAKFTTWMTRIVVNQCLMRLRRTRRAKFFSIDETLVGEETMTLDLPSPAPSQEKELGRREVGEVLRQEIRRIPPLLRHVFILRDVEELPMADVAARLGITVAAAKSRLLRARQELRVRMEKHHGPRLGAAALTA
jgi:RNA polymerase sigma-70 factor (ECF subfamily)